MNRDELIEKLKPFWKELCSLEDEHLNKVIKLETKMCEAMGVDDLEFFWCDGYCGIGNESRTLKLIHDYELE